MVTSTDRRSWQDEGRRAYEDGRSREANPYDRERQWNAWYEWDSGWSVMQQKIARHARRAK